MSVVLQLEGVGKSYASWSSNLARFASWFGARVQPVSEVRVLHDVGFSLAQGQTLALIGQNGAGKSTLLKLVTGTVRPTVGTIAVRGRVHAILELGLGFHPEHTGRENIYQAGGLMGFSREELSGLMPAIEDFAELGDYFDEPLRVYSSGMQARLAFSLATAVRPDLLIIDEVLSVGDRYFQHKSFDRIRRFREAGTTILFVSHSMNDVQALCDRVILLDQGRVLADGRPDEVIDYYNAFIAQKEARRRLAEVQQALAETAASSAPSPAEMPAGALTIEQRRLENGWSYTRSGSLSVRAVELRLLDAGSGEPVSTVRTGQKLLLRLRARSDIEVPRLVLGFMLRDRTGQVVWGTNTWHTKQVVMDVHAGEDVCYDLRFTCSLGPGSYSFTSALTASDTHIEENYEWQDNALVFDVVNPDLPFFTGTTQLDFHFAIDRFTA